MQSNTPDSDLKTLIGHITADYLHQEQEAELLAADAESREFEGYSEFSADLEEAAWDGAQSFNEVLIKKACEHATCDHLRCSKSTRIGGIEI